MHQNKLNLIINRCIAFFVIIGIVFSFYNFICNRSLWADEALLALNIANKSWGELLTPLDMNQIAPIGFLMIEKLMVSLLGNHDWVLRLFPFLAFLMSIPLLISIVKLEFKSDVVAFFSAAIFVLNSSILYYSAELKQYSVDVFVALLILYSLIKNINLATQKEVLVTALVGAISIFLSNIAIIILFSSGIYILFIHRNNIKQFNFFFLMPLLTWLLTFFLYYIQFIRNHPTHDFMISYWSARKAFPTQQLFSTAFRNFVISKTQMLFSTFFDYAKTWLILLVFFACGIFTLFKKKQVLFFCVTPLLIHFLLSYFRLYPFETRLVIYLIPMIIVVLSSGFVYTINLIQKKITKNIVYVLLILPLTIMVFLRAQSFPIQKEELKKSLEFINSNLTDDEQIFVYYISNPSFNYYKTTYPSISDKPSAVFGNWHIHGCGRSFLLDKNHQPIVISEEDLLKTKGKFWLLFSGVPESDYFKIDGENEEKHLLNQFLKNKYKILQQQSFVGSSCYLIQNATDNQE